jgi:hypothetical protein
MAAMRSTGHDFFIVVRDKECTHSLLESAGLSYVSRGKGSGIVAGKLFNMLSIDVKLYNLARKYKPDIFFSFGSPYTAHAAFLLKKPHIVFDDTDYNPLVQALYRPFSQAIVVPTCYQNKLSSKHIVFDSFLELAYLHPKYFQPDKDVISLLGLNEHEKYAIVRFVAWQAAHDLFKKGISINLKVRIVKELSKHCRVFISSETELPCELKPYSLHVLPEKMHDVLAQASLYYGESPTMAAESAALGVPAIFASTAKRGYIDELALKYKLINCFSTDHKSIEQSLQKAVELLKKPTIKEEYQKRRYAMLSEKIDITTFMIWFTENYPASFRIMKENSEYQNRFRTL